MWLKLKQEPNQNFGAEDSRNEINKATQSMSDRPEDMEERISGLENRNLKTTQKTRNKDFKNLWKSKRYLI